MLTMGGGALQQLADCKRVHGVITTFRRVNRSEDQSTYQITLQPFLSLLDKQFRSHRFFVNKSVPEVVEQVLQEHHLHDWEYEFNLKQHYPRREQINQYQESDLAFIQRLLAEVGIFYFFTLQEEAQSEVVHFADAQRALMFDKTLPVNSPSGMSDSGAESIWGLSITHNVVEANVTTRDYNPRDAQSVLQSATADMTRGNGEGITYGEVYHYKLRHRERGDKIDPQTETANFYARLDHERFLAHQTLITANSTAAWLAPARADRYRQPAVDPACARTGSAVNHRHRFYRQPPGGAAGVPAGGALQRNIVLASAAAAAPEGDWHHDGAGDQREGE